MVLTINADAKMQATIQVMNMPGEVLTDQPFNASEIKRDVSAFPSALYLLVLKSGTEPIIKKFVKDWMEHTV